MNDASVSLANLNKFVKVEDATIEDLKFDQILLKKDNTCSLKNYIYQNVNRIY